MATTQTTTVVNLPTFHRFFRGAAGLDVDKDDLKRYSDFIFRKVQDLLVMAQVSARFNDRGMIEDWDLPITKGLQDCVHDFEKMDEAIELQPLLGHLAARPQLDLPYSQELERRLPLIAGGVTVALARAFKIIEPSLKNPGVESWERAFRVFDTLL